MKNVPTYGGRRLVLASGIAGIVGLVVWILGAIVDLDQAMHSYLTAYVFAWSIAVGTLIMLMIGHATRARWFIPFRRLAEGTSSAVLVLVVLFVPIAVLAAALYPWVSPEGITDHHLLEVIHKKRAYLNYVFWVLRAALFFAIWCGFFIVMRRHTREHPGKSRDRLANLGSFGLVLVGLAMTFAAFDWVMSLDPAWYSTMFGVYVFAGGFLSGLSLLAILAWRADRADLLADGLRGAHYHALGRMMLAFTIFWGYIGFYQLFLIYIANKPHEVTYYVHRLSGAWPVVGWILIFGHFVVPFFVLLSRPLKFRRHLLAAMGIWIVVMHYVDAYWLVMPELHEHTLAPSWMDLAALVGVGGVVVAFCAWRFGGTTLIPDNDPNIEYASRYSSL